MPDRIQEYLQLAEQTARSLTRKSAAEKEKERPSVLAQLKAKPPCQFKRDNPKTRRKEMER